MRAEAVHMIVRMTICICGDAGDAPVYRTDKRYECAFADGLVFFPAATGTLQYWWCANCCHNLRPAAFSTAQFPRRMSVDFDGAVAL